MTANAGLLPDWTTIRRDYVEPGVPGRVVVRRHPAVELFVDAGGQRLGALMALPQGSSVPPSPFTDIDIEEVRVDGVRCLSLSTDAGGLFGTFYLLLVDVARAIIERGEPPTAALEASLAGWRALLHTASLMSDERQLGLFGELWLLERLLGSLGTAGLDAWVGPDRQAHDFRLGIEEFEVKATTGGRRVHMINGLQQLTPSQGARLHLLSLRVADAGAGGETLGETVARIIQMLEPVDRTRFLAKLAAVGFRTEDSAHYSRRRRLADPPRLIEIAEGVPRLTGDALAALPSQFAAAHIRDVTYRIDVDALGVQDGSAEFTTVLPA